MSRANLSSREAPWATPSGGPGHLAGTEVEMASAGESPLLAQILRSHMEVRWRIAGCGWQPSKLGTAARAGIFLVLAPMKGR